MATCGRGGSSFSKYGWYCSRKAPKSAAAWERSVGPPSDGLRRLNSPGSKMPERHDYHSQKSSPFSPLARE